MHKLKLVFATGVLLSSVGCIPQPLNDEKTPDSTKFPETVKEPVHQKENKEDTAHVTDVAEQPAIFGVESIDVYPSYVNLDGMGIYSSVYFFHEDTEWQLQLYAEDYMYQDGEWMLSERGRYVLLAVSYGDPYVFLDEVVQLGVPEADVWVDTENQLHITVKDVRSAKYAITDYVYNSSDAMFFGRDVLYGDGINYFGTTAR